MFRFEHPHYLFFLLLIPITTVFFVYTRLARKRALLRFGDPSLTARLMPNVSNLKHPLKFGILMLAVAMLIIAWANPQLGTRKEKVSHKSSDVILALDISNSMLSDDVKPSRLDRAKAFSMDLVNGLRGERIGNIVFAGNAYLNMPLTTDYAAAAMFINSSNPEQAPTQGTALGEAIDVAEKAFGETNLQHKVLIIVSDGEDHDNNAIKRAKKAGENGLLIFTIGVGSKEGGLIPIVFNGQPDFKRDGQGQPIKTTLNEDMMKQLAAAGNGDYFNISNTTGIIDALKTRIEKVEKKEFEQRLFNEYESYYQYFVLIALLILIFEFMLPYRKSSWLEGRDIFKV
jgi:Ca-activated chloride channel homolog